MERTVVYLVGPSGVGKYTIGNLLADRAGCHLVHNHFWNNVVFSLIDTELKPFPEEIWDLAGEVRWAVLKTIAHLAPRDNSYIFTHAVADKGGDLERRIADQIAYVARERSARLLTVRLFCSAEELARRVQSPERAALLKTMDPSAARDAAEQELFDPGFPNTLELDTTNLTAGASADRILAALTLLELA